MNTKGYVSLLFILLVTFCRSVLIVRGIVIGGKITACEKTSNIEAEMKCAEKLSVAVTLSAGDTSVLQYSIGSVTKNDVNIPLTQQVELKITQTNYKLIYPLTYVKTFNAKPTERIVYKNDILVPLCKDSPSSAQPTCGWMVDNKGQNIPDSQGFCCSCTISDVLGTSQHDPSTRSGINCRKILEKQSSAHCLQMHDINYLGFQPESPVAMYQINIEMSLSDGSQKKTLVLSPKNKIQSTDSMGAELVGNFATFEQVQSFGNMMLFVADGSNDIANRGSKYYMLIDKQYISLTGSECDKIGSLFSAFRNQPNGCEKKPMSCLQNQLLDFHNADLERIKQGGTPLSHISRYGVFDMQFLNQKASLVLTPKEIPTAMINLMIDAASITSIISSSTGKILSAQLKSVSIQDMASLFVEFTNTGTISATYRVSVDCSEQVTDTQIEQRSVVDSGKKGTVSFDMHSTVTTKTIGTCTILLQDMLGKLLDQKVIQFDTKDLIPIEGDPNVNQNGTRREKGDSGGSFLENLFGGKSGDCSSCKLCCYSSVRHIGSGSSSRKSKKKKNLRFDSSDESSSSSSDESSSSSSDDEYQRRKALPTKTRRKDTQKKRSRELPFV